jgi:hypothetical protein
MGVLVEIAEHITEPVNKILDAENSVAWMRLYSSCPIDTRVEPNEAFYADGEIDRLLCVGLTK